MIRRLPFAYHGNMTCFRAHGLAAALLLILSTMGSVSCRNGREVPQKPFKHPGGFHSLAQIEEARSRALEEPAASAVVQLMADADAALLRVPQAVKVFSVPFYYRNSKASQEAKKCLSEDASAAYALALAWHLGPEEGRDRYAEKAVEILNAWATTNRKIAGWDGPLVACYAGVPLIFAADLLWDYQGWEKESQAGFGDWVRKVFWKNAQKVKRRANNHGDWGTFASIASSHYLDDAGTLRSDVERVKTRIDRTIAANGELPLENLRTNSGMWYTYFALAPMTGACQVALDATGTDLFTYVSPKGRSIRQALNKYFEYCQNPGSWPYRPRPGLRGRIQRVFHPCANDVELPTPDGMPGNLYEAMISVYAEKAWDDWLAPYRPVHGCRAWIYPTLLRAGPKASN